MTAALLRGPHVSRRRRVGLGHAGWLVAVMLLAPLMLARRRLELARRAEHELRGPLAALALGVEQVRRGRSGVEPAGMLEAQLDRSRAGLSDLAAALDGCLARQPGGLVPLPAARYARIDSSGQVPLHELTRQAARGWSAVAAGAGRKVTVDWRAGPLTVSAERDRLAQALGNLLSNAVEHGAGDVRVVGRRGPRAVRVEVTNSNGVSPGPRAIRPPSAWAGGARRRRGRGLAVARRAAELSGSHLEVARAAETTTAALEVPLDAT